MDWEMVADARCSLGEAPLWHPEERALFWADLPTGRILRTDGRGHGKVLDGPPLGGLALRTDGALLLFLHGGAIGTWRDGAYSNLVGEDAEERGYRYNDVVADPLGRVFAGSVPLPARRGLLQRLLRRRRRGRLYRIDPDGTRHRLEEPVGFPNGMGFSAGRDRFYLTDSASREILAFAYEQATGRLSDRRVFARFGGEEGVPDGLAVDSEDHVWSALFGGRGVVRFTPRGDVERRVPAPVRLPTSLAFGGPGLCDLYLTTAGGDGAEPGAGAVYRGRAGVTGKPAFEARLGAPA